jgi:hypothetical protein
MNEAQWVIYGVVMFVTAVLVSLLLAWQADRRNWFSQKRKDW